MPKTWTWNKKKETNKDTFCFDQPPIPNGDMTI